MWNRSGTRADQREEKRAGRPRQRVQPVRREQAGGLRTQDDSGARQRRKAYLKQGRLFSFKEMRFNHTESNGESVCVIVIRVFITFATRRFCRAKSSCKGLNAIIFLSGLEGSLSACLRKACLCGLRGLKSSRKGRKQNPWRPYSSMWRT